MESAWWGCSGGIPSRTGIWSRLSSIEFILEVRGGDGLERSREVRPDEDGLGLAVSVSGFGLVWTVGFSATDPHLFSIDSLMHSLGDDCDAGRKMDTSIP